MRGVPMAYWTMYNLRRFSTQIRSRSYVAYPNVVAGFLPTDLGADLWAWYDPSDSATVTIATGVSNLADKSGNARDATQGTGAQQPTVATAVQNGLDALRFDAAGFNLVLPDMSALTAGSVILIAKRDDDPALSSSSGGDAGPTIFTGSAAVNNHHPYTDGSIYDSFGVDARYSVGNPSPSLASWFIFSIRSATADYEFYVNGTSLFAGSSSAVGFRSDPRIAQTIDDYRYVGHIGEIVLLNVGATTLQRQKVEGYLAWKWGVQAILPVGHPYELAPP
jgi:hypothetical protein